jgi:hypothetical protein
MPSTGTSTARGAAPASIETIQPAAPQISVSPQVRKAAHWFFWMVAASAIDSALVILDSRIPRFIGFGAASFAEKFSGGSPFLHVMVNGWLGTVLLFAGFCALEGRRGAFALGLAILACDSVLLIVAQDYLSILFHAFVLYQLYRGFAAANQPASEAV